MSDQETARLMSMKNIGQWMVGKIKNDHCSVIITSRCDEKVTEKKDINVVSFMPHAFICT